MKIRQERESDYEEVYELVRHSFSTVPDDDGSVPDYLNEVRTKEAFIPELSLVLESDSGKIIGQIVLYETHIVTSDKKIAALLLSPICVHPEHFRRGNARLMAEEAFRIAREMGYGAVFLCGEPSVYRKLGFKPSCEHNIFNADDDSKKAEWCMVREIAENWLNGISGTVDIV